MPFNEKGEFIRAEPNPNRWTTSTPRANQLRIPPPGRPRITSSQDRPRTQQPAQPRPQPRASGRGWSVLGGILLTLLAVAASVGLIWLLVTFHPWILMGLVLLVSGWLRERFR